VETTLSGISELPFSSFLLVMQPIHLAIGIIEGLVTAGVISFIWKARPEILEKAAADQPLEKLPLKPVLIGLALATLFTGGILSWYASEDPDGLEWSIFKVSGHEELPGSDGIHRSLEGIQEKTAFLADYDFMSSGNEGRNKAAESGRFGTSVAGLVGGLLVLLVGVVVSLILKKRQAGEDQPCQ